VKTAAPVKQTIRIEKPYPEVRPVEPGKSKKTGEEFNDSAVLPGQMEMTLAMA